MTPADNLCQKLERAIANECPAGLGAWEPAWSIVEEASTKCLSMVRELEQGTAELRPVELQANEVVRAWRRARKVWEEAGKP